MSLHHKLKSDCHAARIYATGVHPPVWAREGSSDEQLALALAEAPAHPPARTRAERVAWALAWADDLRRATRPWVVSPSGLAALAADDAPVGVDDGMDPGLDDDDAVPEPALPGSGPDGTPVAPPHGRGGTAVGLAVHSVLETVPLDGAGPVDAEVVDALAHRFAAEHLVDDPDLVRDLATSALSSATLAEARAGGRLWREVPVVVPVAGHLVEGFIDLLHERPDGSLVVVDWKTDRGRSEAEVDASVGRYRAQGAAYALAVTAATGRPVTEVRFVFCRPGGAPAVERSIADLAAAVAEVEASLAQT